ncbi:peptide chain release factor family protein [Adhaeretor mobilis]|uniref:Peptide chain release factor 2 n=1 Tax=Adhaeretor mobilis TaxID=1930276 RepID=A0A517MRK5_9BACT|nr:peptide chain release factor-like protein [Adhaeretor mobilis]QDS97509.1 Peptide chain release factor 2 [Adhaeretor mobilis]
MHAACQPIDHLLKDCTIQRTRGSGPGGQHRNKVETAIVVTHTLTGVRGEASERRSQADNRKMAIFRLRLKLAVEVRTPQQAGISEYGPSELWQSRRQGSRIAVNDQHDDFPSLLAEALNSLANANWQPAEAAEFLGVSSSQLVKLCKQHAPALTQVNRQREALGFDRLR